MAGKATVAVIAIPEYILRKAEAIEAAGQCDYRFRTDGCSGLMSWVWRAVSGNGPPWEGCCVHHDFKYWMGGSREQRERADKALYECVAGRGYPGWAMIMWLGVRPGGHWIFPSRFRWGYRWRWPRRYTPEVQA